MRVLQCLFGKLTFKLILGCILTAFVTGCLVWLRCPKINGASIITSREEDNSNPDPQIYCADLVSAALREREDQEYSDRKEREEKIRDNCPKNVRYETIDVIVNGEKKLEGRVDTNSNEAYVPFSFVKNYFEIYGDVKKSEKRKVLEWKHCYSEIHETNGPYDPKGPFLWFQGYHVEGRQRVLCISGREEVPVSTQWNPKGHFYPIQIAQYGLSHYSMFKEEKTSNGKTHVFEDAEADDSNWVANEPSVVEIFYDKERATKVVKFSTPGKLVIFSC